MYTFVSRADKRFERLGARKVVYCALLQQKKKKCELAHYQKLSNDNVDSKIASRWDVHTIRQNAHLYFYRQDLLRVLVSSNRSPIILNHL